MINLKYYYNAATDQLEPISFDANALGNTNRLSLTTTYGDPQLQAAYVQSALHVSQPEYLAQLQADLAPAWQQLQRILGAELPDPKPPWDALRARQTLLQRSLKPVRPVFAYLETTASPPYATLRIDVGNVINLPVEIAGFDIDGATYLNIDPAWVTADQDLLEPRYTGVVLRPFDAARSPVVRYVQIDIPLTAINQLDNEIDFNHERDIHIDVNIFGAPEAQLVPVRTGLPEPLSSGATE